MQAKFRVSVAIVSLAVLTAAAVSAAEPEWGNLKARFIYNGKPPERAKVVVERDKDFCGQFDLHDETLLVDKDGGLANVVVWLDSKLAAPRVHPDYAKTAKDNVIVDSRGCRFVPHVSLMRTTQTLLLRNSDKIAHNARYDSLNNNAFNVLLPGDGSHEIKLDKPDRLPSQLACSIHTWRKAVLLVQDHPYLAASDLRGHVDIANLPVGKWTFVFWQERCGYLRSVDKGGDKLEWPKGRVEIEIKPGENDLGEIKLAPEIFER